MPSYVIAGASRGLGYALATSASADKDNTVVALVRDVPTAKARFAAAFPDRKNIHVARIDLDDLKSIEAAVEPVSNITGGSIDVLIINAGIGQAKFFTIGEEAVRNPEEFEKDVYADFRTNVMGPIHMLARFAPLVEKSQLKKAVAISSGLGDIDLVLETKVGVQSAYGISKAALNMAIAKFHLEYCAKGIVFMAVSPGVVATEFGFDPKAPPLDEAAMAKLKASFAVFQKSLQAYNPNWSGTPLTPEESASMVLDVINKATLEHNGGIMVSQFGNKQWL